MHSIERPQRTRLGTPGGGLLDDAGRVVDGNHDEDGERFDAGNSKDVSVGLPMRESRDGKQRYHGSIVR